MYIVNETPNVLSYKRQRYILYYKVILFISITMKMTLLNIGDLLSLGKTFKTDLNLSQRATDL